MTRLDARSFDALRPISVEVGPQKNPEGSVLYRCGNTTVLVAVSIEEGVRDWLRGQGKGWITAEYAMHPRANPGRQGRDGRRGQIDGRSQEIQRLVGRGLRAALRLEKLGERTITIDCDVLDADGGTRTASITGGFIALAIAVDKLMKKGLVGPGVLRAPVAAISVGMTDEKALLDLNYIEDRDARVDLNVVAAAGSQIVEVQGTAEGEPVSRAHFDSMVDMALGAMPELMAAQEKALAEAGVDLAKLLG